MTRKNVLVSAYFAQNVGDDLFLKVLFDRYKHVNWYLLTGRREHAKQFKHYAHVNTIPFYREINGINFFIMWSELTKHIKKYDAFVLIGGSLFMQNKDWKNVLSTRQRIVNLFKQMKRPCYIIGANFGPFSDDSFLREYASHFLQYEGISFRDTYSYKLFNYLSNIQMAPDAVLSLTSEDNRLNRNEKRCIGLSMIDLRDRDGLKEYKSDYEEKIKEIILYYLTIQYEIKFFSFCEYEGDLRAIKTVLRLLPQPYRKKVKVINYTGDLTSFLDAFKTCTLIIGTRFHSLILAMIFRQKYFPIIYSEKTIHSLKDIGVDNLGRHIRDLSGLDMKELLSSLNSSINPLVFKEAEKQFYYLDNYLNVEE